MITCTFEDGGKGFLRHVVIDAIIVKDNNLLMVKRSDSLVQGGKWGLIGGFVERDETLETALSREVFEETGYRLKGIKFFTIIDSPKRHNDERQNISFVFICQAGDLEGKPDWESTEQKWFDLDTLPKEEEIAFDHYKMIQAYLENKNKEVFQPFFKSE